MGVAVVVCDRGVVVALATVVGLAVGLIVAVGVGVDAGQVQSFLSLHCGFRQKPLIQAVLVGH